MMINELMMELADDLQAVVKGVVVIADNGGVDATLMKSLTPSLAKKCIVIFQVEYTLDPNDNDHLPCEWTAV